MKKYNLITKLFWHKKITKINIVQEQRKIQSSLREILDKNINIKTIYQNFNVEIENKNKIINDQKKLIDTLSKEINDKNILINNLNTTIINKEDLINNLNTSIIEKTHLTDIYQLNMKNIIQDQNEIKNYISKILDNSNLNFSNLKDIIQNFYTTINNDNKILSDKELLINNLNNKLNDKDLQIKNLDNINNNVYKYIVFITGLNMLTIDDIENLLILKNPEQKNSKLLLVNFQNLLIEKYHTNIENHLYVYLHLVLLDTNITEEKIQKINEYIFKIGYNTIKLSLNNNELDKKYKFLIEGNNI